MNTPSVPTKPTPYRVFIRIAEYQSIKPLYNDPDWKMHSSVLGIMVQEFDNERDAVLVKKMLQQWDIPCSDNFTLIDRILVKASAESPAAGIGETKV